MGTYIANPMLVSYTGQVEVNHEDQMNINVFARESTHLDDLNQQIKAKEVRETFLSKL